MKKLILTYLKFVSIFINSLLRKIENLLTEDNLTLVRITRNTLGKNLIFYLNNSKSLDNKVLFYQIYMFLITNEEFLKFGTNKVIIVNGGYQTIHLICIIISSLKIVLLSRIIGINRRCVKN